MQILSKTHHLVGGTLLVAGTSIGVGMLALPVATAAGGFFPAIAIYLLCWLFMVSTGLLILEACMWCPNDSNLITITRTLLGKTGSAVCWATYLFLLFCLMVAHTAIGGIALKELFPALPDWLSSTIYVLLFAPVIYLGTAWVDRLNKVLMAGVVATFFLFVAVAIQYLDVSLLARADLSKAWVAIPLVLTAFGFQTIVPTVVTYMERDYKKARLAIWIGTSLPLILYFIWEFLILGVIPIDLLGDALQKGQNAVTPLQQETGKAALSGIGQAFALLAMTTSYICLAIGFFDFLADGFQWEKKGIKKVILCLLVFAVPLLIVFSNPALFLAALNLAGSLGVTLLLGILPVLSIWSGRYIHKHSLHYQFIPGGKASLFALLLASLIIIALGLVVGP